jgi:hypothetical protein
VTPLGSFFIVVFLYLAFGVGINEDASGHSVSCFAAGGDIEEEFVALTVFLFSIFIIPHFVR